MKDLQQMLELSDTPPYSEAELYTWFGVAASAAQSFETALATFTIIMRLSSVPGEIPSDLIGNPFESIERKTLGQVLSQARRVISFNELLDESLQEALRTRNYLFHHFFPVNIIKMESEEGRTVIVEKLQKSSKLFFNMADALLALCEPTIRILKMTHSELDAELERWRHEQ